MKNINYNNFNFDIEIASPGRINLIGEHTDYNNGFVLPTAIEKKIHFKFKKNNSKEDCSVFSENFNKSFSFKLNKITPSKQHWENYLLGVIFEIQKLTTKLEGFNCAFNSSIPIGSGISSSAALECGFAFGLNELFNLNLSKQTIVELSQRAEHNFVGTKCGIMDQFASVMSKKNHVILLDCETLDFEYVPIKIEPYKIILLNTNVSHSLASSEYNTRRKECEKGVEIIQQKYKHVNSLRNVTQPMLKEFNGKMPDTIYNRCLYVVEENERVINAVNLLKNNKLIDFGKLMFEAHYGLQHKYKVSCKELDFLVDFSRNNKAVIGARMMGGGFGGCTINLVHKKAVESFIKLASDAYFTKFNIKLTAFEAMPSAGTTIIN